MLRKATLVVFLLLLAQIAFAQDTVTVPDLTGMSVPQAAALLNKNGLRLGAENPEGWTQTSAQPADTIAAQSVAAGQSVARGTAVDITVLRSPNVFLVYDDNDLTFINHTGGTIDLNGVFFNTVDGAPASLAGSRWARDLKDRQCTQVWSVGRNGPKGLDECDYIQNWFSSNNPAEHFWTGAGGTTAFTISQYGVPRATCPIANPGRCEFYVASSGSAGDVTEYIYFAYTTDRLVVVNKSDNQWMPLGQLNVYNLNFQNGEVPLLIGDPALFAGTNPNMVGDVTRLAPGQCVYLTNSNPASEDTPERCDIVARLDITPTLIFWSQNFEMDSVTDGQRHGCPAAVEGKLTLCIMPR